MRFMIMVKATPQTEAGEFPEDVEQLFADMTAFHEELHRAGILLDASGLQPSSTGWRVRYAGDRRTVVDGPFAETKELVAGYTLIQVASRQEAMDWALRYPNPAGAGGECEIEVRPLYELEDFEANVDLEKFRKLDEARRQP